MYSRWLCDRIILTSYVGHAHVVRSLLRCDGDVDILGSGDVTPLQSASLKGHLDTVRCLPVLNVQPCRRCKSPGRLPHNTTTLCSTQSAPRRHSGLEHCAEGGKGRAPLWVALAYRRDEIAQLLTESEDCSR